MRKSNTDFHGENKLKMNLFDVAERLAVNTKKGENNSKICPRSLLFSEISMSQIKRKRPSREI